MPYCAPEGVFIYSRRAPIACARGNGVDSSRKKLLTIASPTVASPSRPVPGRDRVHSRGSFAAPIAAPIVAARPANSPDRAAHSAPELHAGAAGADAGSDVHAEAPAEAHANARANARAIVRARSLGTAPCSPPVRRPLPAGTPRRALGIDACDRGGVLRAAYGIAALRLRDVRCEVATAGWIGRRKHNARGVDPRRPPVPRMETHGMRTPRVASIRVRSSGLPSAASSASPCGSVPSHGTSGTSSRQSIVRHSATGCTPTINSRQSCYGGTMQVTEASATQMVDRTRTRAIKSRNLNFTAGCWSL